MKKPFVFVFLILVLTLSASSVQAAETHAPVVIRSINQSTSSVWWGASVSDMAWSPWGSFFGEAQIKIMKKVGATAVRLPLDKFAWDTDNSENVLGLPYPDYVKRIVEWCKPELKVEVELALDSSNGEFDWEQKEKILASPTLRSEWINWGKEVVTYVKPDGVCIIGEPGGGNTTISFDYYYDNFVLPSISAYRSIDPNIAIFVMGFPFYELTGFFRRPIDDPKVYYCLHVRYNPSDDPSPVNTAYANGDFFNGRQLLQQLFEEKIGPLPKSRVSLHEFAVGQQAPYPNEPNWKSFAKDVYDYISINQMLGLFQLSFGKNQYLMVDPDTRYTTLTEYGQFWSENIPGRVHEVAIAIESYRTVTAVHSPTKIYVNVSNQGNFVETLNITTYANSNLMETQTLTLDALESTVTIFVWTPSVSMFTLPRNCTLSAKTSSVLNETNIENNNATCYVQVSIKGDMDANGKVNIIDLSKAGRAFETDPGHPRWNSNADINEDGKIDMIDMAMMAKEFGKTAWLTDRSSFVTH